MLTLRCTAKLLKKMKQVPTNAPSASDTTLGDWYANVFQLGENEFILFTSSVTLLPIVVHGRPHTMLGDWLMKLDRLLKKYGVPAQRVAQEMESTRSGMTFAKTVDRRVLGSMNDFIRCMESYFSRKGKSYDPTTDESHHLLWEMPMSLLGYLYPVGAALNVLEGHAPGQHRDKHVRFRETEVTEALFPGEMCFTPIQEKPQKPYKKPTLTVLGRNTPSDPFADVRANSEETRRAVRKVLEKAIRTEESPLRTLRAVLDATDNPGYDLAMICAYDPEEPISMHALLLLFAATDEDAVPETVRELVIDGAAGVLDTAMRTPEVPDMRKVGIGPLLARVGEEMSQEEYIACFQDFEAVQAQLAEKMPPVYATPECVAKHLQAIEFPLEADCERLEANDECWRTAVSLTHHALRQDEGAAAMLLCAAVVTASFHGRDGIPELMDGLRMFNNSTSGEVLWQLEALRLWPFSEQYGALAGRIAEQLRARGITPRHTMLHEFSHGHISMVDGSGARQLALFYRTPEGGMDAMTCISKDCHGLKDCIPCFTDSKDIEHLIKVQSQHITWAPCTNTFGREIFADALALSLSTNCRIPPAAFFFRQYLGEEPLPSKRREPNLGAYMLEAMRRTPEMVEASAELMECAPFGDLLFCSDTAYDFLDLHLTGRKKKLPAKVFEQFLTMVCANESCYLLPRMAANLEVESLAGRAKRRENQLAAKTYLALKEEVVPFERVPYIRALAEESIRAIRHNQQMGYSNQREANSSALEDDEDFFQFMQQQFGPFGK